MGSPHLFVLSDKQVSTASIKGKQENAPDSVSVVTSVTRS